MVFWNIGGIDMIPPKVLEGELVQKNKTGPKSKYTPNMCQIIIDIAAQGGHIAAMRNALGGISKDTWYAWKDKYQEFKDAVDHAEAVSQEFYENIGLNGITGHLKGFNSTAYIHLMSNKFKEDYSRSGDSKTEINVTNNTVNLTSEQVTQRIAQRLEQLQNLGVDILNENSKPK